MTNDQRLIQELCWALQDVLVNLDEDIPCDQWSKHLTSAVNYASELLTHATPEGNA